MVYFVLVEGVDFEDLFHAFASSPTWGSTEGGFVHVEQNYGGVTCNIGRRSDAPGASVMLVDRGTDAADKVPMNLGAVIYLITRNFPGSRLEVLPP